MGKIAKILCVEKATVFLSFYAGICFNNNKASDNKNGYRREQHPKQLV